MLGLIGVAFCLAIGSFCPPLGLLLLVAFGLFKP